MDDLISRQAAIEAIQSLNDYGDSERANAYGMAEFKITTLPSVQPEQRWIPCSDGLPREYTRVIGYMAWKAMTAIEYQHGRWYSIDHLEPLPDEAVSHWMPLPKPPKEGAELI